MGEKEGKEEEKKEKKGDGEKKGGGKGEKKEEGGNGGAGGGPVVLKVDLHCEGCAMKIKRSLRRFEGVEKVTTDLASNKVTVEGKVDPWKLKERVEEKTNKKVDIISPANPPKKDAAADGGKKDKPAAAAANGNGKEQKKSDDKKPKPPTPTTVVLKIRLHCDGCIQRIRKTILKVKGVENVIFDAPKDLVTVSGTMDVETLPGILKGKLKRSVEIVSAGGGGGGGKKEKSGGDGGEKKEKGGDGGGGEKKEKNGGGEKKDKGEGGEKKDAALPPAAAMAMPVMAMDGNRMDYYAPYGYRIEMVHAPQIFSDENPNACSVM